MVVCKCRKVSAIITQVFSFFVSDNFCAGSFAWGLDRIKLVFRYPRRSAPGFTDYCFNFHFHVWIWWFNSTKNGKCFFFFQKIRGWFRLVFDIWFIGEVILRFISLAALWILWAYYANFGCFRPLNYIVSCTKSPFVESASVFRSTKYVW